MTISNNENNGRLDSYERPGFPLHHKTGEPSRIHLNVNTGTSHTGNHVLHEGHVSVEGRLPSHHTHQQPHHGLVGLNPRLDDDYLNVDKPVHIPSGHNGMGPEHGGTVDLMQNAIEYKQGNKPHHEDVSPSHVVHHHPQQQIHPLRVGNHHINTNGLHYRPLRLHGNDGYHDNMAGSHNPVLTSVDNIGGHHQQVNMNHHGSMGGLRGVNDEANIQDSLLNHNENMEGSHNSLLNLHGVNNNGDTMENPVVDQDTLIQHEKEGMKINRIGTGYPIFNLPTRPPKLHNEPMRIDQGLTDFVRPLPPDQGQNPYEVLTSANLGMDYPGVNQDPNTDTHHHEPVVFGETNHQPLKVVVSLKTKEQETPPVRPNEFMDIQDLVRKGTVSNTKNDTMPGTVRSIKLKHKHRRHHRKHHRKQHHRRHRHRLR